MRVSPKGLLAAAALPLGLVAVLFIPWESPPAPAEQAVLEEILSMAHDAAAETWAPAEHAAALAAADSFRRSVLGQRRRPPLLRRYAVSRQLLASSRSLAGVALEQARSREHGAREDAESQVEKAAAALAAARLGAETVRLRGNGRAALSGAATALDQARRQLARQAYAEAGDLARSVLMTSRHWHERSNHLYSRLSDGESLRLWQRWVQETIAWSASANSHAIVVDKAERRLSLYHDGSLVRTFRVDLGQNPLPDKAREGDNATPEGRYRVETVKDGGETRYHRALLLDYPTGRDRERFADARRQGNIPTSSRIGSLIEIHGHGGRGEDWTNGCVALTDAEMDYLAARVEAGTPVTIVGALRARGDLPAVFPDGPSGDSPQP